MLLCRLKQTDWKCIFGNYYWSALLVPASCRAENRLRQFRRWSSKPYTGKVWSDDQQTWQLTAEEGQVTAFTLHHADGSTAFTMQSPADTLTAFDESGNTIPIDTFAIRYKQLAQQIPQLLKAISGENE